MALTNQQSAFLQNFQTDLNTLSNLIIRLRSEAQLYASRSYSTIPDVDLADVELTATSLAGAINMVNELGDFFDNEPVQQGAWQTNLDLARRL